MLEIVFDVSPHTHHPRYPCSSSRGPRSRPSPDPPRHSVSADLGLPNSYFLEEKLEQALKMFTGYVRTATGQVRPALPQPRRDSLMLDDERHRRDDLFYDGRGTTTKTRHEPLDSHALHL